MQEACCHCDHAHMEAACIEPVGRDRQGTRLCQHINGSNRTRPGPAETCKPSRAHITQLFVLLFPLITCTATPCEACVADYRQSEKLEASDTSI